MNRRDFLELAGLGVAGHILFPKIISAQTATSKLEEYRFQISPNRTIGMRETNSTPEQFLRQNPNVEAVINGPQYRDKKSMGLAYLSQNHFFGNEDPGDIRAYFSVTNGGKVNVSEDLDGKLEGYWALKSRNLLHDYWFVLGARPPLVINGVIPQEALSKGYEGKDYRSAIGTRGYNDICFVVSNDQILMSEWARRLKEADYKGAINLDGGPISQMAVRDRERILVKGGGTQNTRLVVFSYKP